MTYKPETPFDSIEGALEYVSLLAETVEETKTEIAAEISQARGDGAPAARRADALRLVAYKLDRLAGHFHSSRRLLNDLRTLRRLLLDERAQAQEAVEDRAVEDRAVEDRAVEDRAVEDRAVEEKAAESRSAGRGTETRRRASLPPAPQP